MDEVAPRVRRSDRPMASPDAGRGDDGRRRMPTGFGTVGPIDDANLTMGRRIGVLVVLAALAGAIILAAGGVGGDHAVPPVASRDPAATTAALATVGPLAAPPTGVPTIRPPKEALIASRTIDLRLDIPDPGTTLAGLEVRIYRNSRQLASQRVTEPGRVKVKDVPLRRGTNRLTATLANSGGEGPRSGIVTLTVDDQAPKLNIRAPRSGVTLNQPRIIITGRTEPGLTVTAKDSTTGSRRAMVADASGAFGLELGLAPGRNTVSVRTRDAAGNVGSSQLVIVRGDGRPSTDLRLSRRKLRLQDLPGTVNARVTVRDADGRPVRGAEVTFTMSPPGQLTTTYVTTTAGDGTASWSGIRIARAGSVRGDGIVTARAVLPNGTGSPEDRVHFQVK